MSRPYRLQGENCTTGTCCTPDGDKSSVKLYTNKLLVLFKSVSRYFSPLISISLVSTWLKKVE